MRILVSVLALFLWQTALADDCVVLEDGRVADQGTPLEVLARRGDRASAPLEGVDNLLRLPVAAHDADKGLSFLDLGAGERLAVPLVERSPGASVDVGFFAEDVIVASERPGRTSARNALPATVVGADRVGHEVLVRVRVGDGDWNVRLTPGAARELGLDPGARVHVLVKSTACHVFSR